MHNKPRAAQAATFPITISTPFGVLRLAYHLDLTPCPDCGASHGSLVVLDASPRLRAAGPDVVAFLDLLPDLLSSAGDLAFLHCLSGKEAPKAASFA